MTLIELKSYIAAQLVAPVTLVQKIINCFYAVCDFFSSDHSGIPDWTLALTFNTDGSGAGKFCIYSDTNDKIRFWKTKIDGNINNEPPTNPLITEDANWIEVSPAEASALRELLPGIYGSGLVIGYHNHSVDGKGIYILLNPTRPYESTNIEDEIEDGDWELIAGQSNAAWGGLYNFAGNGGDFPTALTAGTLYIAEDDHGAPGDADYVPAGTWFASSVAGANAFNQYYYK